ncbi:major facilitator superfamily MFS_1 [Coriobacterium glomerans PW2]|uniref:Major facilitator superfamily MFS_1 n=1 Tax=Coriobacterium glomerans (strain ATCC 49209 / DSM 20642 / JCM 10262 / PW2) TaxID=700015 RepID=F2NAM8_CORGP|nr:MFS transporter [Coriobacterium glomerans]AEB07484.1 major facilitator superfamily MFS_1 [Coriobacterium glomerans PW2]
MATKSRATTRIVWLFALGKLGWPILSGVFTSWLVYFYQPEQAFIDSGQRLFVTQGSVVLGMTAVGLITAAGRFIGAFMDPWIAGMSDACSHHLGRRIPFMRYAAIPFGAVTALAFFSPVHGVSWVNNAYLFIMVIAFYVFMAAYSTPYSALLPELGRTQDLRIKVATCISATYFLGTAIAYLVPGIAKLFQPVLGTTMSFRAAIAVLSIIAIACMLVPAFAIDEHVYAETTPSMVKMFTSLRLTLSNRRFQVFVVSNIMYWIAITMFQTGLPFYVTSLMHLPASMTFILFALMTGFSLACYPLVNILATRMGKKRLVGFALLAFSVSFGITSLSGLLGIAGVVWGVIVAILAAVPLAILGILLPAVVADIAEADAIESEEPRQGMFYAAQTFSTKLGQALAMILFTSVALVGEAGFGYRLSALTAMAFCLISGIIFLFYNERRVLQTILSAEK